VDQRFQELFHSPPGVLFTFPSRYSCTIGRLSYLALRGGPRRFTPAFPDPALLGITNRSPLRFAYGALTHYGPPFQHGSTTHRISHSATGPVTHPSAPTTPNRQRHRALPPARFRLIPFRSPLLRESQSLSSPRGTEMFQFPRYPPLALCIQTRVTPHHRCRVSPFGHPRINARSATPRGFTQPPTSFIGNRRQGIHRWPFLAWKNTQDARAHYELLNPRKKRPGADAPGQRNRIFDHLPAIDTEPHHTRGENSLERR
jgi:hypothetical protein